MGDLALLLRGTFRVMSVTLGTSSVLPPRCLPQVTAHPAQAGGAYHLRPGHPEENCIGCRLCEYICPSQIIGVTLRKGEARQNGKGATYAGSFVLDYQACMQCELCVQVCPTDAIVMTRELSPATYTRDGLLYSMERLFEEGKKLVAEPALESYATASRLQAWTDAKRDE